MLIEGGYLHSLKALLEKADSAPSPKPSTNERPPKKGTPPQGGQPRGLGASIRKLRARLFRKTAN